MLASLRALRDEEATSGSFLVLCASRSSAGSSRQPLVRNWLMAFRWLVEGGFRDINLVFAWPVVPTRSV
jgi:hypothetical protein